MLRCVDMMSCQLSGSSLFCFIGDFGGRMEDLLQIGVITSTHGVRGEVKVFPTTDDNKRFKKLKECFIEYKNEMIPVKAQGCKFFKNMVILKFEDIDNIDDVE